MKKFLLAMVVLSAVSFTGCKSGGGDPKVVLEQFFDALSKNNMEAARKLATKDSKTMIDMMEMGMKMGNEKKESEKFSKENIEIGEAKIDGDKAVVPVKDKTTGIMNYTLKKEDGSWKVAFDKSSLMSMGMEKMNEKGINPSDSIGKAMDQLKNINMDSLKEGMKKGMEVLDSVNKAMKEKK